MYIIKVGK
jgi:hypothetical protein